MSKLNPYQDFLDDRPVDAILMSTAEAIRAMLEQMGDAEASTRPAPGKWSAAEIVSHLADCELVFGFRLRQTLAENNPTIQPFDQDNWAKAYNGIPADEAIEAFSAMREWNLRLIETSLPAAGNRKMTHPERGTMTFLDVVETMAGHDLNHLAQLRKITDASAARTPEEA
jgi:hypothetical protein